VSESCQTRIAGWLNPRVYWTDAVGFRCTWEHLGAPMTSLEAPGCTGNKPGSPDQKPGSPDDKPGSKSNQGRAVREKHLLWEYC